MMINPRIELRSTVKHIRAKNKKWFGVFIFDGAERGKSKYYASQNRCLKFLSGFKGDVNIPIVVL